MKQIKMLGNVKWFKKNKGYGYIIGADEENYFFELINCLNMNESFVEGDVVEFIHNIGSMNYATEVKKVESR